MTVAGQRGHLAVVREAHVLERLGSIDLLRRPDVDRPRLLVQLGVAVGLLVVAGFLRLVVDDFTPGVLPFARLLSSNVEGDVGQ